jgi:hypothetical protein
MQLANLTASATGVCVDELGFVVFVEPRPVAPLEGDPPQPASDNATTTSTVGPAARQHGTPLAGTSPRAWAVRFLVSGGSRVGIVRPLSLIVVGKTCEKNLQGHR